MLELDGLQTFYGDLQALHGVTLEVREGEIVSVIGSNGAGKTTTLLTISGVLRPQAGAIEFDGRRIDRLKPMQIVEAGLGHVPGGRQLFPSMTVEESLVMGACTRQGRAARAESLEGICALFPRLRERRRQLGGSLSGGEQQMVAIGRGLMSRPRLLMLDEPSLGLSPMLVTATFDIIREVNRGGPRSSWWSRTSSVPSSCPTAATSWRTGRSWPRVRASSFSVIRRCGRRTWDSNFEFRNSKFEMGADRGRFPLTLGKAFDTLPTEPAIRHPNVVGVPLRWIANRTWQAFGPLSRQSTQSARRAATGFASRPAGRHSQTAYAPDGWSALLHLRERPALGSWGHGGSRSASPTDSRQALCWRSTSRPPTVHSKWRGLSSGRSHPKGGCQRS
jgi:branched-chain amino acid transport system ATP-binding protein